MRRRVRLRQLGFWYALAVVILKPLAVLSAAREWRGLDRVPAEGGVILAVNHISHADPVFVAEFVVHGAGRTALFLAKSSLFRGNGLVGRVMRGAGQIPVYRQTSDASLALRDAVTAVQAGGCVVLYPEGTVSRDPGKWPMVGKTGVARLALLSGAPVIPVAQWGAQEILDSYRSPGLHLLPRHRVVVQAGPAVDLSPYVGREPTAEVLRGATSAVMDAITSELEQLRGQRRPAVVHDWRAGDRAVLGRRPA